MAPEQYPLLYLARIIMAKLVRRARTHARTPREAVKDHITRGAENFGPGVEIEKVLPARVRFGLLLHDVNENPSGFIFNFFLSRDARCIYKISRINRCNFARGERKRDVGPMAKCCGRTRAETLQLVIKMTFARVGVDELRIYVSP